MSEPLRFPVADRNRPFDLAELSDMCRETLEGDERRVVRQIGLGLVVERGEVETFGDALDLIAAAGPAGRRAMVDEARVAVGLPTIEDERFAVRQAAINRAPSPGWGTDSQGRRIAACAAAGCDVWATNSNGSLRPVADRRWWCPVHRDQAGADDHLPEAPRYVLNANSSPKPVGEELERLHAEDRERREEFEQQEEAKRREGERLSKLRQEHEEGTTVSVMGIRVRNGKVVSE